MKLRIGISATILAFGIATAPVLTHAQMTADEAVASEAADLDFNAQAQSLGLIKVCYARNLRGEIFEGRGLTRNAAQDRAFRNCAARSVRCRVYGCQ